MMSRRGPGGLRVIDTESTGESYGGYGVTGSRDSVGRRRSERESVGVC
jgi:hypothetical protein